MESPFHTILSKLGLFFEWFREDVDQVKQTLAGCFSSQSWGQAGPRLADASGIKSLKQLVGNIILETLGYYRKAIYYISSLEFIVIILYP